MVALDHSPAMARAARRRRGLETVVAAAGLLPFTDGAFGSVLVASGVLDFSDAADAGRTLAEVARVLRPQGLCVLAAFAPSPALREAGGALGLLEDGVQRLDRIAALWSRRADAGRVAGCLAAWTGLSPREALRMAVRHRGLLAAWFDLFDRTADAFARGGAADPIERVLAGFDWSLASHPGPRAIRSMASPWFTLVDSTLVEDDHLRLDTLVRRV